MTGAGVREYGFRDRLVGVTGKVGDEATRVAAYRFSA